MFFVLLWIATVSTAVFWVAMHAAWIGRNAARPVRHLLLIIELLVPLYVFGALVVGTTKLKLTTSFEPTWLGYAWSQFLAFLAGAAIVLYLGRRREPASRPVAAGWRVWLLALAWIIAGVIWSLLLRHMDRVALARYADALSDARSRYLANMTPSTPESTAAARLYESAFARLSGDPDTGIKNLDRIGSADFDANDPTTVAYLGREQSTIAYLRQVAAMQACRFEQDTADPDINSYCPDGLQERQAAVLLGLDAREEAARGRVASAMTDVNAAFAMARNIGQRPFMVQGLIGAGTDDLGCRALEAILPAVKTKSDLAPLRLSEMPPLSGAFQQALRGEEWFQITLLDTTIRTLAPARANTPSGNLPDLMPLGAAPRAYVRVFYFNVDPTVQYMRTIEDYSVQPYHEIRNRLRQAEGLAPNLGFGALFAPAGEKALAAAERAEATELCARVAVAMTRYRLDHGTLPARLDQLVPAYLDAIPVDPYDGNPLRLTTADDSSIIYSIGPDGVDNGGIEINNQTGLGDIIFTLKPATPTATSQP
jgi:hypothetical protein